MRPEPFVKPAPGGAQGALALRATPIASLGRFGDCKTLHEEGTGLFFLSLENRRETRSSPRVGCVRKLFQWGLHEQVPVH